MYRVYLCYLTVLRYLTVLISIFLSCFNFEATAQVVQLPQRMPVTTTPTDFTDHQDKSVQNQYEYYYNYHQSAKEPFGFHSKATTYPNKNETNSESLPVTLASSARINASASSIEPMPNEYVEQQHYNGDFWEFQFMPEGLIWRAYMAGMKESRMALMIHNEKDEGWLWDVVLGGRIGVFRYGDYNSQNPQGIQFDLEGAAFPRLNVGANMDLDAADFRFGMPVSWTNGKFRYKAGYYHLSSHLGDEKMLRDGLTSRINYSRDAMVLAAAYHPIDTIRIYVETEYAFYSDVAEEWAFQFGFEYGPACPTGLRGAPFFAMNGHLRQELDFSGNFVLQTGWAWRGQGGRILRTGLHYYNGSSNQYEFFSTFEHQIGVGLWFDY